MDYKYYKSDFNLIVTIGAEYTNSGGALVTLDNTAEFNFRFYTTDKENLYVCSSTGGVSPVLTRCTKLGTDKVVCHFDRSVLELSPGQLYLEAEFIVPDAKFEGDDKENVVRLYKTDVTLTMAPDKDTEGEFEVMIGADFLKGADGADGAPGAPGADGKSAYQAALDGGFVGTEAEFNAAMANAGSISAADKEKLDALPTNEQLNTALAGKASTAVATTSANGLMSADDKKMLDNTGISLIDIGVGESASVPFPIYKGVKVMFRILSVGGTNPDGDDEFTITLEAGDGYTVIDSMETLYGESLFYEYISEEDAVSHPGIGTLTVQSEIIGDGGRTLTAVVMPVSSPEQLEYKMTQSVISTTYSGLVSLRRGNGLKAGQQYRITDYSCIVSQNNVNSAGHQFDIIVTADTSNRLSEHARACLHSGDTYFRNSKIEAWEIDYCLDNDTSRFGWATSNGKGVIYRMRDDFGNECPYDFKNIRFKRTRVTSSTFQYNSTYEYFAVPAYPPQYCSINGSGYYFMHTFSKSDWKDYSLYGQYCHSNRITAVYDGNGVQQLNDICFHSDTGYKAIRDNCLDGCKGGTLLGNVYNNIATGSYGIYLFGCSDCNIAESAMVWINAYGNRVERGCYYIFIGKNSHSNHLEKRVERLVMENNCYSNRIGADCECNRFLGSNHDNHLAAGCGRNCFGQGVSYVSMKPSTTTGYGSNLTIANPTVTVSSALSRTFDVGLLCPHNGVSDIGYCFGDFDLEMEDEFNGEYIVKAKWTNFGNNSVTVHVSGSFDDDDDHVTNFTDDIVIPANSIKEVEFRDAWVNSDELTMMFFYTLTWSDGGQNLSVVNDWLEI